MNSNRVSETSSIRKYRIDSFPQVCSRSVSIINPEDSEDKIFFAELEWIRTKNAAQGGGAASVSRLP